MSTPTTTSTTSPNKPSPWAKIDSPIVQCSLEEVMSEQLAQDLYQKETTTNNTTLNEKIEKLEINETNEADFDSVSALANAEPSVENDLLLAQLLQHEFDKEFDDLIKSNERTRNRESRVQISYEKFKSVHPVNIKDEIEINSKNHVDLDSETESEDGNI